MISWKLSENGAVLIYLMLLSCIAAVLLAWRMLPKGASSIEIYDVTGSRIAVFSVVDAADALRYKMDDVTIKVFQHGDIKVFPMSNIRSVDIRP